MDDNKVASCIVYDCNGEIIDNFDLKEGESIKHITGKQRESYHDVEELRRFSNQMGGFITMFYFNHTRLFENNGEDAIKNRANIARLMMLVTYMNYDNTLVDYDNNPLKPKTIMQELQLGKSVFDKFWKEVRDAGIIYKDDKQWKVSTEWFIKGSVPNVECNYIRIYRNTVRKLYLSNKCSAKNHLALSYVFEMIPHIHFKTNFIVHDVTAHPLEIKYMDTYDLCRFLGIDDSKESACRLAKQLKSLRFECTIKGKTKSCFLFNRILVDSDSGVREQGWAVNPMLVNSMSSIRDIHKCMDSLFVYD